MALRFRGARIMTRTAKFYSFALAALVFAPFAYAMLHQAAGIVA